MSESTSRTRRRHGITRRESLQRAGALGLTAAGLGLAGPVGSPVTARSNASAVQGAGVQMPDQLGADFLVYPETSGTVTFSNCWGGDRAQLVDDWIAGFNKIYPNINVQNNLSECASLPSQQTTTIAGGAPDSILMINSDHTAFFADQGAIMSLDDLIERDSVNPDWYYESEWAARGFEGSTYGLPNVTAGALHLLFVNRDMLEILGLDPDTTIETWQDLDALVEPAKAKDTFVMDPAHVSGGMTIHQVLTYANGGQYWDDTLQQITWNDEAGLEAAEWLLNFVKSQAGSYQDLAIAVDRKSVFQAEDWSPGKYVAMVNGSWAFFQLAQKAPDLSYSTFTFPRNSDNPNSEGRTPTTGGWMFSIASDGENHEAAWEWIKYTCASHAACDFVMAQNRPSPVRECNEDPALTEGNPYWPVVTDDLAQNIAVPMPANGPALIQVYYDMEDAILYEDMSPKEALDSFAEQGQQLLDEWNESRA